MAAARQHDCANARDATGRGDGLLGVGIVHAVPGLAITFGRDDQQVNGIAQRVPDQSQWRVLVAEHPAVVEKIPGGVVLFGVEVPPNADRRDKRGRVS